MRRRNRHGRAGRMRGSKVWLLLAALLSGAVSDGGSDEALRGIGGAALCEVVDVYSGGVNVSHTCVGAPQDQDARIGAVLSGSADFAGVGEGALTARRLMVVGAASAGELAFAPALLQPVAVVWNVDGLRELALSLETLAGVLSGRIAEWNDTSIAGCHPPSTRLPAAPITVVVHDDDASGATAAVRNFLAEHRPASTDVDDAQASGVSRWPPVEVAASAAAPTGPRFLHVSGGSDAVAAAVRQTPYSVGYVVLAAATTSRLPTARVEGRVSRTMIPPTSAGAHTGAGIAATAAAASVDEATGRVDLQRTGIDYPLFAVEYIAYRKVSEVPRVATAASLTLDFVRHAAGRSITATFGRGSNGNGGTQLLIALTSDAGDAAGGDRGEQPLIVACGVPAAVAYHAAVKAETPVGPTDDGSASTPPPSILVSVTARVVLPTLRAVAYGYPAAAAAAAGTAEDEHGRGIPRVEEIDPAAPEVASPTTDGFQVVRYNAESTDPVGIVRLPYAYAVLVVAVHARVSAGRAVAVDVGDLRALFEGKITGWDDAALVAGDSRLIPTSDPVTWGAVGASGTAGGEHGAVYGAVGGDSGVVNIDEVVQQRLDSHHALAAWVHATPGAAAVLPLRTAEAWGLTIVHPRVGGGADGNVVHPSLDDLQAHLVAATAATGRLAATPAALPPSTYPFWFRLDALAPANLADTPLTTACDAARERYTALRHVIASTEARGALNTAGMVAAEAVVSAAARKRAAEGSDASPTSWAQLTCNGIPLEATTSSGGNQTWIGLVASMCVIAVGGIVAIGVYVYMRRHRQLRHEAVFGTDVLARELADTVAILDVSRLAGKVEQAAVVGVDETQAALLRVAAVLQDILEFVPPHVKSCVRGVGGTPCSSPRGTFDATPAASTVACPLAIAASRQTSGTTSGTATGASERTPRTGPVRASGYLHALRRSRLVVDDSGLLMSALTPRELGVLILRPRAALGRQALDCSVDSHMQFLECALNVVAAERGVVHRVSEDSLAAVWGAPPAQPLSAGTLTRLLRCALATSPSAAFGVDDGPAVHAGVGVGRGICAVMGTAAYRSHHIFGACLDDADVLARAAVGTGAQCVVCENVLHMLSGDNPFEWVSFFPLRRVGAASGQRVMRTALLLSRRRGSIADSRTYGDVMYEVQTVDASFISGSGDQVGELVDTLLRALGDAAAAASCVAPLVEAVQLVEAAGLAPPMHMHALFVWLRRVVPDLDPSAPLPPVIATACGGVVVSGSGVTDDSSPSPSPRASSSADPPPEDASAKIPKMFNAFLRGQYNGSSLSLAAQGCASPAASGQFSSTLTVDEV